MTHGSAQRGAQVTLTLPRGRRLANAPVRILDAPRIVQMELPKAHDSRRPRDHRQKEHPGPDRRSRATGPLAPRGKGRAIHPGVPTLTARMDLILRFMGVA